MFLCFILCRYVDDEPRIEGELHGALVLSSHAHAEIQVDPSDALQMEGVVEYISVKDIPSSNNVTGMYGFVIESSVSTRIWHKA